MENRQEQKGYFIAHLENGCELFMEPHCECGAHLEEEYYCEKCQKHCLCLQVRCTDEATLNHVSQLIRNTIPFRNLTAVLHKLE